MEQITKRFMNWASILEDNTRAQAQTTSEMPFIHPHLALMPDAHLGKGATVGSVIPTLGAIIPAAVGVDIGCGMIAVRTQYAAGHLPGERRTLRESIEAAVPLSAGKYNRAVTREHTRERLDTLTAQAEELGFDPGTYAANWELQLGTLGSGNHFIEVSLDEDDRVWLFLHSGSRGVGNKIAQHHIKVAQDYCARHSVTLPDRDLAYLVEATAEFDRYVTELAWAQRFAYENRAEMMDRVATCFEDWIGSPVVREQEVNCHHNYTLRENHFGKDVWLSRKGAISAREGEWGLIPGSMVS
ncbi:RtcB family protein [Nocardioides ochotonae]|uniref:RtcB family protein n=1 Tax=Nocardioides ochotonae TaxID=2685869 RepID=UPI00140A8C88|nr:RtcB family protein [Nocardioides ochotonae]